ncbi:MAG: hypothetical protein ABJO09_17150 [Hyphomicrobiales bacterium]
MPSHQLNKRAIEKLCEPGRYSDGSCLYLVVTPTLRKQFVTRLTIYERQTDLGLEPIVMNAERWNNDCKPCKASVEGCDFSSGLQTVSAGEQKDWFRNLARAER